MESLLKISPDHPRGIAPQQLGAWITTAEASRRSGRNQGRIRANCEDKWSKLGLAQKRENTDGVMAWFVNESADPLFAPVKSADAVIAAPRVNGTDQQEAEARRRLAIIQGLDRRLDEAASFNLAVDDVEVRRLYSDELKAKGISASPATIYNWQKAYREANHQLSGLFPRNVKVPEADKKSAQQFAEFFELIERYYLTQGHGKKSRAYASACDAVRVEKLDIAIPHAKAAQRFLLDLERTQPAKVTRYRGGPTEMDNKVLGYIPRDRRKFRRVDKSTGEITEGELRSDGIWCADHHICDTIVSYKGKFIRPWLTAILDIRSNKIVGRFWSPAAPNKHNVLLALRDSVIRSGLSIPDRWYVDNGKDFDAWMFQGLTKAQRRTDQWERITWARKSIKVDNDREHCAGLLHDLQIQTMRAAPYNARAKPVEGFFGIYESQFGKTTYTYCGRNPQEKPEQLDQRLRSGQAPTFEDYITDADAWIYNVHHHTPLTSKIDTGKSREQVYAENRTKIKTTTREHADALLLPIEKAKVTRMGVTYQGWHYIDNALAHLVGTHVRLKVDPLDVRSISVFSLDGTQKLCNAIQLDLAAYGDAIGCDKTAEVRRRISEWNKAVKHATQLGGVVFGHVTPQEMLATVMRAHREAEAPAPMPTDPPTMQMIQAPFDVASIDDRPPLKRAVGAESLIDFAAIAMEPDEDGG
jgi:hypothetical protein